MNNIVRAVFGTSKTAKTRYLWQWDYGQILQLVGLNLPTTYTVHFSNQPLSGEAKTMIGTADGVDIPDEYLTTGLPVYAWVFLHAGEADGETVYMARIPVQQRPKPVEDAPTPVQRGLIDTALELLNDGVQTATQAAQAATEAAELLENADAVAETLEPDAQATASYVDGTFSFGIPKGDKGDKGDTGAKGDKGDKGDTGAQGPKGDTGEVTQAEFDALEGEVDDLKSAVQLDERYALLLHDEIPDTTQAIAFDSSGNVSTITHTNGNNVAVRTDAFTFATNSITEVRTLNTGETLTIVTNTTTLSTTVTYAAAA